MDTTILRAPFARAQPRLAEVAAEHLADLSGTLFRTRQISLVHTCLAVCGLGIVVGGLAGVLFIRQIAIL